ncbi:hypothetical protein T265_01620 [Opisthorchis viverrini]|uniref:Protein-tyrosine phosphatase n=1 Tax=Opisthorchis viverrini TaxID=6198 RepID=A0A075AIT3_OPIVI|nr:hypothetical protein T265_01620 [Opisthorchis viverrini]KER32184.1 hypothetical protein T265_01620 [Opisthorchis viverrini]
MFLLYMLKVYTGDTIVEGQPHLVTTRTDLSALSSLIAYIVLISLFVIGLLVAENAGFHIFPFSGPSTVELKGVKNASTFELSAGQTSYDHPTAAEAIAQNETEQFAAMSGAKEPGATRPTSIGIDNLSSYLQECLQPHNSFLVDQFNALRRTDVDTGAQHALSTSIAMQPGNSELNRSMDALPYDQNLVLVQGNAGSLEEGRYINASYIFDIAPPSEPSEPPAVDLNCTPYIATQAPTPGTAGDFWQMVFEQKANSVIQLAPSLGEFIPNFDAYWPTSFDDVKIYTSGTVELQLNLVSESAHSGYMRRKLTVTSSVDPDNPHEVTQFQLLNWPEQGVPDSQEFRFMLTAYRVFKFTESPLNSPTVVHCSNGVGRTGTFIAADIIKNHLEEGAEFIDIAGIVEQLRECRMNMVQKNTQYVFLHMFTKTAVDCVQPRQVGPAIPTACSPRQDVVTVQHKTLRLVLFVAALLMSLQYEQHGSKTWSIYAYCNTLNINQYFGRFDFLYFCQTNKHLKNNGRSRMKGSFAGHLANGASLA